LTEVDTILFDKTGTLTSGDLEVVGVLTFGGISERKLIRMVGSAESRSEHALAAAIVRYMKAHEIEPHSVSQVTTEPGLGLTAMIDGSRLVVGNRALMREESIREDEEVAIADGEMKQGRTVVHVALDGHVVGLILLAD